MCLRVIDGGLRVVGADMTKSSSARRQVQAEAARRLKASGYERHHIKHLVTGEPVPSEMRYLKMQIAWVAEKLEALDPIPSDFTDDSYWPSV